MKSIVKLGAVVGGVLLLAACAPQTRFEWGSYQQALYLYAQEPSNVEAYKTALEDAIAKGRETNRLAPGLQAELGYIYLEEGDTDRAATLFAGEIAAFPESATLLTPVITRIKSGEMPAPAAVPTPEPAAEDETKPMGEA